MLQSDISTKISTNVQTHFCVLVSNHFLDLNACIKPWILSSIPYCLKALSWIPCCLKALSSIPYCPKVFSWTPYCLKVLPRIPCCLKAPSSIPYFPKVFSWTPYFLKVLSQAGIILIIASKILKVTRILIPTNTQRLVFVSYVKRNLNKNLIEAEYKTNYFKNYQTERSLRVIYLNEFWMETWINDGMYPIASE